jgi:flagella basal body P-ring formation protein FlgA
VTVADIASVSGPEQQAAEVRTLVVAQAPAPGTTRPLRKEQIAWKLAQSRVRDFTVIGPAVVTLSRATRTLSPAELDAAAQGALRQAAGEQAAGLELQAVSSTMEMTVPEGQIEVVAHPSGSTIGSLRSALVTVSADGQVVRTVTLRYRARLEAEAPVATRYLASNETLTPSSWSVQRVDIAGLTSRPLAAGEMEGRRLRRTVNSGAVLTLDNTEAIPLVLKGSPVVVSVHVGAVTLTCEGVARSDGSEGQAIDVQNPSSKQLFRAVVTGPGKAEVNE